MAVGRCRSRIRRWPVEDAAWVCLPPICLRQQDDRPDEALVHAVVSSMQKFVRTSVGSEDVACTGTDARNKHSHQGISGSHDRQERGTQSFVVFVLCFDELPEVVAAKYLSLV